MLSGLPINVEDLLHLRSVESARVEFKASWNEGPTRAQVVATICAFANDLYNVGGGYVILGVEEMDGVAVLPPRGLDPARLEKIQAEIRESCHRIEPQYHPVLSPEVIESKHILVIWAPGSDNRPHQAPSPRDSNKLEYFVRLGASTAKAEGQTRTDLLQMTAKVPFDDRRAANFTLDDLRATLVREHLRDVRSSLIDERDDAEVYRRMRLTAKINSHEVPRNVALLFFSDDPEAAFPGARIEVVHFAGEGGGDVLEEQPFRGPLPRQLRDCLNYLSNLTTSRIEKRDDRSETSGWVSFPYPALEEAVVNAVYHRSYEGMPEPTKVYLYPDRIEVTSYPGPAPGLLPEHFRPNCRIPQVPARNRRIGDFLKELRLAEMRSTGVPTIFRKMAENGSPEPRFEFDEQRTYFTVILPAHPEYVALAAVREAALLIATGDRPGALRRLESAQASRPGSGTIAAQLITELCHSGDLAGAERVYASFQRDPERKFHARVIAALAEGYINANREADAQRVLDQLPGRAAEQDAIDLAILERRARRQERAHQLFRDAGEGVLRDVRATHEFAQTKISLAQQSRRSHRKPDRDAATRLLREAEDLLRRTIQLDASPTRHAWAWFDLSRVLRWLNAPESEVRHALEEARRLLPGEQRFLRETSGRNRP
jgi:ATP-dependent DNA helicase RecG